jgi:hypothetical protein
MIAETMKTITVATRIGSQRSASGVIVRAPVERRDMGQVDGPMAIARETTAVSLIRQMVAWPSAPGALTLRVHRSRRGVADPPA